MKDMNVVRFSEVGFLTLCKREKGSCGKTKTESCRCDMNKIIKTFAVLMAGMVLTTGTAVAAPRHGWHRPHCPPPPRHHVVHHVHHGGNAGWVALGAAAVGAVVGGLIGAAAH